MATKSKPYEQFGPYILFKKLEADSLGELFRAARVEGSGTGPFVALRRMSGGDRAALTAAAQTAEQVVSSLTGPTFARDQRIEVIAGTPAVAHEYAVGRSLRYIVDRARGAGAPARPLPMDQALVIAERVALSLATTGELRFAGDRLVHGGLIPQFVWISDDGEIRVAGQALGSGLVASLRDERVAADIGRHFAPEMHHGGVASKTTEVYSLGAILYLVMTGLEPPDPTRTSAFMHAIRAAKTMDGTPMPDDIRTILEKSLNIDPAGRYASPADMCHALSTLTASGRYSATSFNLAFYLSSLLKKELESEAAERERESNTDTAAFMVSMPAATGADGPHLEQEPARKNRVPLAIAATLTIAAVGAGGWFVVAPKQNARVAGPAAVAAVIPPVAATPVQPQQPLVPEPIVATASTEAAPPEAASADPAAEEAARKKAFDDAVKKRLQQEMLKLQAEYTRQLRQQQRRDAPVLTTIAPQPQTQPAAPPERTTSVAQIEPQSAAVATQEQAPALPPANTATATNNVVAAVPPPVTASVAPPVVPRVREGDVVDMNELDTVPTALRAPKPVYPPIAARQKIEATVMASILISEDGNVLDVKILRGDSRFGFNDAATRAFRSARYTSPMKDGQRVKTWVAQMIQFNP